MFLKVALKFGRLSDTDLAAFAKNILSMMTGNAAFASPPVTMAALDAAIGDFNTKVAAALDGGKMATSAKNASRQVLLGKLHLLASYVQMSCNNDLTTLQSSGFDARSTERASVVLEAPDSPTITNDGAGKLLGKIKPIKGTSLYEGQIKPLDGDWMEPVFSGDSQHILFAGLSEGVKYVIRIRALGGSTGEGEWSDEVKHMSL